MFLGLFSDIGESIADFFYSILWLMIRTIFSVIDTIQEAFYIITGVETITIPIVNSETGETVDTQLSLLEGLFGISRNGTHYSYNLGNPVHKAFLGMLALFTVLLVFCIVCSIIKISTNKQDKESMPSMYKLLWKSVQAIGIVLILPVFFVLILSFMGLIMKYIDSNLNLNLLSGASSIGQNLFKANTNSSVYEYVSQGSNGWNYNLSYDAMKSLIDGRGNFNFFLALLSSCCVLVGIAMCCITVTERLINIVVLYLIAPVICATIPLDDGKRWENWKDTVTSKVTTVGGNVISVFAFLYIISYFGSAFLGTSSANPFLMQIIYLLIAISGAFSCAKGGTLIAGLISSNQGQAEGMSFLASSKLLSMGAGLAGKALGAAAGMTGLKQMKNKMSGGQNGMAALSGAGGASGGTGGGRLGGGSGGGNDAGTASKNDLSASNNFNNTQGLKAASASNNSGGGNASESSGNAVGKALGAVNKGTNKVLGAVGGAASTVKNALTVPGVLKLGTGVAVASAMLGAKGLKAAYKGTGLKALKNAVTRNSAERRGTKYENMSRKEAKAKGMNSVQRQAYNKTANNMFKADKNLNAGYQNQDKLNARIGKEEKKLQNMIGRGASQDKINKQGEKVQNLQARADKGMNSLEQKEQNYSKAERKFNNFSNTMDRHQATSQSRARENLKAHLQSKSDEKPGGDK